MPDRPAAHEQLREVARQLELSSPLAELVTLRITLKDSERTFTIRRCGPSKREQPDDQQAS